MTSTGQLSPDEDRWDSQEVPHEAPPGTPPLLKAAYETLVTALIEAADLRRQPPTCVAVIREFSENLLSSRQTAQEAYRAVQLELLAAASDGGCAFENGLNAVTRVISRTGHVILGQVPESESATCIRSMPRVGLPELLRAMLAQLARAATRFRNPASAQSSTPSKSESPSSGADTAEPRTARIPPRSDGPFDPDGFWYRGSEIRFGRAGKQRALILALWDPKKRRPQSARPIEDVITEVYGEEADISDSKFRQLCSDAQK